MRCSVGRGESKNRKLSGIFSADVAGYSRLTADNEEATVRTIKTYREVMTGLTKEHHGRVVDAKGDNVLSEFPSVMHAMEWLLKNLKEFGKGNAALHYSQKPQDERRQ